MPCRRASSPALRGPTARSSRRLLRNSATARRCRPSFSGWRWRHDSRVDRCSRSIGASAARKTPARRQNLARSRGPFRQGPRARPARGRAVAPSRAYPSPARSPRDPLAVASPPCNLRRHSGVGARADKVALRSCGGGCGHGGGSGRCLFRRPIDSKIAADWDKIALQGNATAARKGAPAEITYAEYLAPERRAGLLRSMQAAPPPASTGETFAEKFCRHFNVPPDRFEKEVLRKALYPLARYFRRLLPDYMRAADRSFVAGIGRLRHRRDLALEVAEFQRDPRNQSFSRNRLRLRISARRMQHLVEAVWGETPTPPRR